MFLSTVHIQAYRSLYDVTINPKPFTVLVGPNNAGKTNLADALQFLGGVARHGLEVAVSREGGYENLAFRRQRRTRRPVEFSLAAHLPQSEVTQSYLADETEDSYESIDVDYSFSLRASSESRDADFRVVSEHLSFQLISEGRAQSQVTIDRSGNELSADVQLPTQLPGWMEFLFEPLHEADFHRYVERRLDSTSLMLTEVAYSDLVSTFTSGLARTRLFQLTPVECRKPGSPTPNPELERHGGNLPAVVRYMQRNHQEAWRATVDAMRRIVPGLTSIDVVFTAGRRLALQFTEARARAWTSDEVSDGTIQALALFTCLFDPRIPLALIEEPENSVHPWILKTFVDACRSASTKQVFLTSHSPALISYLAPEELAIVWRDHEGRTNLRPLEEIDQDAGRLWAEGRIDLYDLIDGGWIREAIPLGLQ